MIRMLAIIDTRFEKDNLIAEPIDEIVCNKIKEFSKLLNGYELYFSKNSKYYI
jgi:hypothetical protein